MTADKERILIIRLGALGDLVFCFQSFHEIRLAYPTAKITLLTREAFAYFARAMPWFDHVIIDTHPRLTDLKGWRELVQQIKKFAPTAVFDLQGKRRQTILYTLLGGPWGPLWSGAAPLCARPRLWPPLPGMSFVGFLAAQLRAAAVPEAPAPDLSWLGASTEKFSLRDPYVVLVPGCSPTAPEKRWPCDRYAELAHLLEANGLKTVIIGTRIDKSTIEDIKAKAPFIIDLCSQTNFFELAGVLQKAQGIVGNDTGPVHLAAALGRPTLALFSKNSNVTWSKPPGTNVNVLQSPELSHLEARQVMLALDVLLEKGKDKGGQREA